MAFDLDFGFCSQISKLSLIWNESHIALKIANNKLSDNIWNCSEQFL